MNEEIHKAWCWYEQECLYAKNYALLAMMCAGMPGPAPSNPAVDRIFPTLLLIKGLAILDKAFLDKIQDHEELRGIRAKDLHSRIELLNEHGFLLDASGVHDARRHRNVLAHKHEGYVDWNEFERHIDVIQRELAHISAIGEIPEFSIKAEASALRESETDPEALFERDISVYIEAEGRRVSEISLIQKTMKDDG